MTKGKETLQWKYFKTACLSLAFTSLGLFIAIIGPTLPTLAYNLHVSIDSISYVITARGFGYLVGSILSGLIYSKFDVHLMMFGALLLTAVGAIAVPFVSYVGLLAFALSTAGFSMGFLDTAGNVLCLQIWGEKSGPYMQTLHFCFAIGTALAPFFSVAFIMDANIAQNTTGTESLNSIQVFKNTTDDVDAFVTPNYTSEIHQKHNAVKYAFILCSVFCLLVSLTFLFLACYHRGSPHSSDQEDTVQKEGKLFRIKMLSLLFFFFLVYVGTEVTFGVYIYTFAIQSSNRYSKTAASHLTSLFWGAFALGRLLAIPLSKRFRPSQLLKGDLLGTAVAVAALNCFPLYARNAEFILWVAVAVYGFSMASIFPSGVSWAEEYITITGKAAMVFVVGASTGEMLCPMIVGQFIEADPMNLMYFILCAAVLSSLNFVVLSCVSNSKGTRLNRSDYQQELEGLMGSASDSEEIF